MVLHDCMTAASLDSPPRVPGRTPPLSSTPHPSSGGGGQQHGEMAWE